MQVQIARFLIMTMNKSEILSRIRKVQKELDDLVDLVLSLNDTPETQSQVIHEDNDEWLNAKQVCRKMGISESTFYAAVKDGSLPQVLAISPRCKRWRLSDIKAWHERHDNDAEPIRKIITGRRVRTSRVRKISEFMS